MEETQRYDEDTARAKLELMRWPNGAICPRCCSSEVAKLHGVSHRPGLYRCRSCRSQFTVTSRTLLAGTRIPMAAWLLLFDLLRARPLWMVNGPQLTVRQLSRLLGVGYKEAWGMRGRVRAAAIMGVPILSTVEGRYHAPRRIKTDAMGALKLLATGTPSVQKSVPPSEQS